MDGGGSSTMRVGRTLGYHFLYVFVPLHPYVILATDDYYILE
jgi:hypothetical protein